MCDFAFFFSFKKKKKKIKFCFTSYNLISENGKALGVMRAENNIYYNDNYFPSYCVDTAPKTREKGPAWEC